MHTKVSGVWKDITGAHVKVAGSWKEITEGWVRVAGVWKQFYTARTFFDGNIGAGGISTGSPITVYVRMLTDGRTFGTPLAGDGYGNWTEPNETDIGDDYHYRLRKTSGDDPTSINLNTWYAGTVLREWEWSGTVVTFEGEMDISDDGGSTVKDTSTVNVTILPL